MNEDFLLDPQPIMPIAAAQAPPPARTFVVHFSDPSALARFGARPQPHWKLAGKGSLTIESQRLVLHGSRPRPFWAAAKEEIPILSSRVINVVQTGRVVQCHVRVPNTSDKALVFWAADEQTAQQITKLLPKERSAQFEQQLTDNNTFTAALQALGTRSVVTPALVAVNCAVFALTVVAGVGLFQANGALLVQWGTNYGPRTLDGEWWRLFSSMFLHFGVFHLLLNMWALWSMGQITEKLYGSVYFLALYVFAGLCGSMASLLWHPNLNSAGASGAIFGVLGGLLAFMVNPQTRIPPSVAATQRNSALVFVAYNLFNGVTHAGIDNAAHIGGLAGGFALGWLLARPLDSEAREDPGPRLLGSLLAGAAVLVALAWPLTHPSAEVAGERQFRHQFELFGQDEQDLLTRQRELDQLKSTQQISQREWGRRVATEILPKWQAAEDRIYATQLPGDSRLLPLREALIEYLDQKRFALDLLSDAAQSGDVEKLQWGNEVSKKNQAKAREVEGLIRKLL
jgi:rhomboid protease GluP